MTEPFICPKCGLEIHPGDAVSIIGSDEARIIYNDDVLVIHQTCEEQDDDSVRV